MNSNTVNISKRTLIFLGLIVLAMMLIVAKIVHIQYVEGNKFRKLAQKITVKEFVVKANRGTIYADDGSTLATSVPKYDVGFDPAVPSDKLFKSKIDALCQKISQQTGVPASTWKRKFVSARNKGKHYVHIAGGLVYSDYKKFKSFPIFKLRSIKGGFVSNLQTVRSYPLGQILRRTIGYDKGQGNRVGIEGAYTSYLTGKDGMQKKQKLQYEVWKPISDINDIEPEDGYDVVTHINVDMQDMAHHLLLEQLQKFDADHGTLVLMEVQTGAIKAMVNLGKLKSGAYAELRNYAVFETHEPGSTFKVFSIMTLLEDKVADTATVVKTGNGVYEIYGKKVRDAHRGGFGDLTLKQVLEKSSNVGVVKMVYQNYKDNPAKFVNRLYNFGLHEKTGIDIKGEGKPIIPDPKDDNWSGISLPWMAYGYGVEMTDIQILTFYNGIANNGKVLQPHLVDEIKNFDKTIKKIKPKVLNNSLASNETIKKLQAMLRGVVQRGTATNINSKYVKIAGKTGTAQVDYWKEARQYTASFVGYFPADNPKYSMIVVIHKPDTKIDYYGNVVAAPVFEKMAEYVFGKMPLERKIANLEMKQDDKTEKVLNKYKTYMPDLRGFTSKEAIYILENMGLKVIIKGSGIVRQQSVPRGEKIKRNQTIELKLS